MTTCLLLLAQPREQNRGTPQDDEKASATAYLSRYDLSGMVPVRFELKPKPSG
jgi:hypothetical protein